MQNKLYFYISEVQTAFNLYFQWFQQRPLYFENVVLDSGYTSEWSQKDIHNTHTQTRMHA